MGVESKQASKRLNRDAGSRESSTKVKKKRGVKSLSSTVQMEELKSTLETWMAETGEDKIRRDVLIGVSITIVGVVSLVLGLFSVLIPATYGVGGWVLYRNDGWQFAQPGKGGRRFVALNAVAWTFYAISLLLQVANFIAHDPLLTFNSLLMGGSSYILMISALFTFKAIGSKGKLPKGTTNGVLAPSDSQLQEEEDLVTPTFNEDLQSSMLMQHNESAAPSFFWWAFIGMQVAMVVTVAFVSIVASVTNGGPAVRVITNIFSIWFTSVSCAISHALGGKWMHMRTNYQAFQPGKGGAKFIAVQAVAWMVFALSIIAGGAAIAGLLNLAPVPKVMTAVCGVLGMTAEFLLVGSLFMFQDETPMEDNIKGYKKMVESENSLLQKFVLMQFDFINAVFGPREGRYKATRDPVLVDEDAHLVCEKKWERVTKHCKTTGLTYLVVGNGFVGKRLVNRLLERGETNVRVFDIVPANHWKGDDRVTFFRGDVTKMDDISPACEGVDILYSTFAIIRFMDRLEHQAFLSYHINVTGTEVLLEACRLQSVPNIIVTSSSHATTDEHSMPRFNRDETAPYVTRKTAHNHYGWTKAVADQICLKADGDKLANGDEMKVTVVRPCSGVFGADDRLSFEKVMDLKVAPSVGGDAVMDWVYCENVVLGHILAEAALLDGRDGVRGEAFCISNDDPCNMADFWMLVRKQVDLMKSKKKRNALMVEFLYVPMAPLWIVSYISEMNQWLFKGKVSLGRDVDMLTVPMLQTASMEYTYTSAKARKVLGYEPVYELEEAIQRSLSEYYQAKCK